MIGNFFVLYFDPHAGLFVKLLNSISKIHAGSVSIYTLECLTEGCGRRGFLQGTARFPHTILLAAVVKVN